MPSIMPLRTASFFSPQAKMIRTTPVRSTARTNSRRKRVPTRAGKALKDNPMKIHKSRKCSKKETHNQSWEKEKLEETLSIRLLPV